MSCENDKTQECCLYDLLNEILRLQNRDIDNCCSFGCDKPFLGPTPSCVCYNTRPLNLYNCQTGELWVISYLDGTTTSTSDVFRIENLDRCCATFRILQRGEGATIIPTNHFFTIDLSCVSAIQCLPDIYLDLC